jgi:hypothetical protein
MPVRKSLFPFGTWRSQTSLVVVGYVHLGRPHTAPESKFAWVVVGLVGGGVDVCVWVFVVLLFG